MIFVFYDIVSTLCAEQGVSVSSLLESLGIDRSAASKWKNGSEPSNPTKKKIADYFGISVSELMTGKTKKAPTLEDERELPHAKYREILAEGGIRLMLDADAKVPQEHLDDIVEFIKFKQRKNGR